MPKILVAYGYHKGEQYARDVGVLFSQINPFYPDVVVKKFPRSYWPGLRTKKASELVRQNCNELMQINQADTMIDLHDDLPMLKIYPHVPREYKNLLPRFEPGFLYFDYGKTIEKKFNAIWNKQNKNKSRHLASYYGLKNQKEKCPSPRVAVEFHNIDKKLSIEEGTKYVGMLARYLLANF